MSLTIAVDCDEVLVETAKGLCAYVKETHGHDWPYDTLKHYMLGDNDHIPLDIQGSVDMFAEYYESPEVVHVKPVLGAKEVLQKWKELGYKLVVVTARNTAHQKVTEWQLEQYYGGIFDDIKYAHHYTTQHTPKSQLCKDIGASYLVEDNLDYALEVAQYGIDIFLLERPWNSWRHEESPHIHKVGTWDNVWDAWNRLHVTK